MPRKRYREEHNTYTTSTKKPSCPERRNHGGTITRGPHIVSAGPIYQIDDSTTARWAPFCFGMPDTVIAETHDGAVGPILFRHASSNTITTAQRRGGPHSVSACLKNQNDDGALARWAPFCSDGARNTIVADTHDGGRTDELKKRAD